VAKFVAMDGDERTSRKVVEDAAVRLRASDEVVRIAGVGVAPTGAFG